MNESAESAAPQDQSESAPNSNDLPEPAEGMEPSSEGPDPVIGAGLVFLGIFGMGIAGALGAHYAFDFGVFIAVTGAALFVVFVTLSALKQRRPKTSG